MSRKLHSLYESMDVIVSPSRPFYQGARFDGFPLGAAVEAGLRGAVVIATDVLGEGGPFAQDELIVTGPDSDEIAQWLSRLAYTPELIAHRAALSRAAFRRVYGPEVQIEPRIQLMESLLGI